MFVNSFNPPTVASFSLKSSVEQPEDTMIKPRQGGKVTLNIDYERLSPEQRRFFDACIKAIAKAINKGGNWTESVSKSTTQLFKDLQNTVKQAQRELNGEARREEQIKLGVFAAIGGLTVGGVLGYGIGRSQDSQNKHRPATLSYQA